MILIIGGNGQVGREIKKLPGTFSLSRNDLDLFNTDRIKKVSDDYRLKRTKPLPDSHNTLENCMQLKYV